VDIWLSWNHSSWHCLINSQLAELAGFNKESGGGAKV